MEAYSSGEDLIVKTRKPYTITKQRERWTEEEHNRFLEALKLYGRAWQRIEEYIGTKTAVQIRSHAQKFFSKLEKEALAKGIPVGQAIDIEIPPPRPKKKPANPYPRKTGVVGSPTVQLQAKDGKQVTSGSSHPSTQVLDLEIEPLPENSLGDGGRENSAAKPGNGDCSNFTIYQEKPATFASSANKIPVPSKADAKGLCNSMVFVPLVNCVVNDKSGESHITEGPSRSYKPSEVIAMDTPKNDKTGGNVRSSTQALSSDVSYQDPANQQIGVQANPALFTTPTVSPTSERPGNASGTANHQKFPRFHPAFHPFNGSQEEYAALLQMSSTFSSLIVSTLLQNPAAHAAANFAASFWPCTNMEVSTNSHHVAMGGFPQRTVNQAPSMAAIAAATVAAATAWWAAHGLLPVCAPFHGGFNCAPATNATTAAPQNTSQPEPEVKEKEMNNNIQNSGSKSPAISSSDSGDDSGPKADNVLTTDHQKNNPAVVDPKDSSKSKNRKRVDRSSCGSNSSSDLETAALEKHDKTKEETKEADASQTASESSSRRSRNSSSPNDPWKEVSEEGRMAFRALFLREVLPQSFSPPHNGKNKAAEQQHTKKKDGEKNRPNIEGSNEDASQLDLNSNTIESCSSHHHDTTLNISADDINVKEGLLTIGLAQGKSNIQRTTGFKPYKRCSVEATESRVPNTSCQDQEKDPKRLRVGEEASI